MIKMPAPADLKHTPLSQWERGEFLTWWVRVFVVYSLIFGFVGKADASFLLGTKNLNFGFEGSQIYLLKDIHGNILEYGGDFAPGGMGIKLAISQKDNLLDSSTLVKGTWQNELSLFGSPLKTSLIAGYAALPTALFNWLSVEAGANQCISGGLSAAYNYNYVKGGSGIALGSNFGALLFYRSGSALTELIALDNCKWLNEASYTTALSMGMKLEAAYQLDFHLANRLPANILVNQGPVIRLNTGALVLSYYYPVQEEYLREKYPHQKNRTEIKAAFPTVAGFWFAGEEIEQETARTYSLMLVRPLKQALSLSIFIARDYTDRKIGIQLAAGEDNYAALGKTYIAKERITAPSYESNVDSTTEWYLNDWFLEN
ncbi:MAG: hypothetical protein QME05_00615 [Candidatus Margulisbacteria bacterium]|nr:hypothetical protein [Candidatus Margulisiibacteriota bacterium]